MLLAGPNKSSPAGMHPGVFQSACHVGRLEMRTSAPKITQPGEGSWGPCPALTSEVRERWEGSGAASPLGTPHPSQAKAAVGAH